MKLIALLSLLFLCFVSMVLCKENCPNCSSKDGCRALCDENSRSTQNNWRQCKASCPSDTSSHRVTWQCAVYYPNKKDCICMDASTC